MTYPTHGDFEDDVVARLLALEATAGQYLGIMRFNTTNAQVSIPSTNPWVVTSAEVVTVTLARPTKVLLDGNIYAIGQSVDFSYQFSNDDFTTAYRTDAYATGPGEDPGALMIAGAKSRIYNSSWHVAPAPYVLLDLPADTWKFRFVKSGTSTGNLAEQAGFAMLLAVG